MSDNTFSPSFGNAIGTMSRDMNRFFGGQALNRMYKTFQPRYGFSPTMNGGTGITAYSPSYSPSGFGQTGGAGYRPFYGNLKLDWAAPAGAVSSALPTPGAGGNATAAGGQWALFDDATADINAAAAKEGVPANLIKSMINNESSGDWARDGNRTPFIGGQWNDNILPYVGIYRKTAESWGYDFNQMVGNRALQIEAMAHGLKRLYDQTGSWDGAITTYFSGHAQPNGWSDGKMTDYDYLSKTKNNWNALDQMAGVSQDPASPGYGSASATGNPSNAVLGEIQKYVGTPYVWGGTSFQGWDCSGFTWQMDQKYGNGSLPQGSHFQYQYAQKNNKLFTDTNQLQPGDLIFWDTGWMGGGGSEMNRAGHVSIYLGNGKMIHAANPTDGTIISDFSSMQNSATFMGAMHQSYGGGSAGLPGSTGTGTTPAARTGWSSIDAQGWFHPAGVF